MPRSFFPYKKPSSISFCDFISPAFNAMNTMPELQPRANSPLKMSFEDQLQALVFFHLEEHKSAQHFLQSLKEDDFAREHIAPEDGIEKSSFSEAINTRGLEQLLHVFENLRHRHPIYCPMHIKNWGS